MLLRTATPADAEGIAALYVRTRRLAYAHFFPPDYLAAMSIPGYAQTWMERLMETESGLQTFVAEADDKLAGFTYFGVHDELEPGMGEIEFMYVAPEHQRSGLGSQLMEKAVGTMTDLGLTSAVLWVYRDNQRARRFYERVGWAHDGAEYDRQIGGWPIRILRYRRSLM